MLAMAVAITVRDVPDEVRDELAARAARAGQSLQEYLRAMLVDATARPPVADVIARARARVDATEVRVSAESIVAARDADRR
jgi:antitoxin FitA